MHHRGPGLVGEALPKFPIFGRRGTETPCMENTFQTSSHEYKDREETQTPKRLPLHSLFKLKIQRSVLSNAYDFQKNDVPKCIQFLQIQTSFFLGGNLLMFSEVRLNQGVFNFSQT